MTENPFVSYSTDKAKTTVDSLYLDNQGNNDFFRKNISSPNVILIVWESLTSKVVGTLDAKIGVTPNIDRYAHEGILFTNAIASGDRTDKGIAAVLSGYPAQPIASIVQETKKAEKLPILSQDFNKKGYETAFYYGGELEFANIKSYLVHGDFKHFITKKDFNAEDCGSKWGAFDHIVYQRMSREINTFKEPFFSCILTLSSHEPYEVPATWSHPEYGKSNDETLKYLNSHYYADATFGKFIENAKQQTWWNNTVIVVVGDHGTFRPETGSMLDNFKTPILWLGGALEKKDIRIDKVVSQNDIAATLLHLVHVENPDYQWSKNLFSTTKTPFAYCAFKNGFGFFQEKNRYLYDNVGKNVFEKIGDITPNDLEKGKSFLQLSFEDYLKK